MNSRKNIEHGGVLPWLLWPLGILVLVLAVMAAIGSRMPDDGRYKDQAVIDLCWSDQKNPALDEAAKRITAQACDKLTSQYREKYGRNP